MFFLTLRYMAGYKCKVTGSSSTKQLAQAQVPKYCANDTSECVDGAKQILVMNRKARNQKPLNCGGC